MQCPDCQTYKRGDNCVKCFLRAKERTRRFSWALKRMAQRYRQAKKRTGMFSRALRRVACRYLRVRITYDLLLVDLNSILLVTADYKLKEKIQERIGKRDKNGIDS